MRLLRSVFWVLFVLPLCAHAEPVLHNIWGNNGCVTLSAMGAATAQANGGDAAGVGHHLVVVVATDSSAGTVTVSDNLGAGGLAYGLVHSASGTTNGNSVRLFVYVAPVHSAVVQLNAAISGGTAGKEICIVGEEFSGMSAAPPYIERTGSAFAATTADPYSVSISAPTTVPDQVLLASFARFNFAGGSGVQPYPLHTHVFSDTNAELSLDIGSGPAATAGLVYTRQFDPNAATPFAGIAVSLRPVSPLIFADQFE